MKRCLILMLLLGLLLDRAAGSRRSRSSCPLRRQLTHKPTPNLLHRHRSRR